MPQLVWNETGTRLFEAGVDRGVLYTSDGTGVAWNGLLAVKESPSGGEPTAYYLDGVKYLNTASRKEFQGSIEAYTYPDEFAEYDGWEILDNGLAVDEQQRKPFGLSYRTLLGNDIAGQDLGYKIHLVYNALATPTEKEYSTISEELDPLTFSWDFTTTPVKAEGLTPLSHLVVDSTKTNPTQLRFIEDYIYGKESETYITDNYVFVIPGQEPRLPSLGDILGWFADPLLTLNLVPHETTGIATSFKSMTVKGDLRGRYGVGIYERGDDSRLVELITSNLDGGNATSTATNVVDGGDAFTTGFDLLINGGHADSTYSGTDGIYKTGLYILDSGSS